MSINIENEVYFAQNTSLNAKDLGFYLAVGTNGPIDHCFAVCLISWLDISQNVQ